MDISILADGLGTQAPPHRGRPADGGGSAVSVDDHHDGDNDADNDRKECNANGIVLSGFGLDLGSA